MIWERDSEFSWVCGDYRIIAGRVMGEWRFVLLHRDIHIYRGARDAQTVRDAASDHSKRNPPLP